MALRHEEERFTKWTHVENGQVLNRRLHRIQVQARDGRMYILTGDKLPDFIQTCSGLGFKGVHTAQILMSPETIPHKPAYQLPVTEAWPVSRDVVHMALGVIGFFAVRFLLNLIQNCS